jgi:hypothetical protein
MEALEVLRLILDLVKDTKTNPEDIVVITPYKAQSARIRALLRSKKLSSVTAGSSEVIQGREAHAVFISTVRARGSQYLDVDQSCHLGFLNNPKLINTVLTRAVALCVVVGDPHLLSRHHLWSKVVNYAQKSGASACSHVPEADSELDRDSVASLQSSRGTTIQVGNKTRQGAQAQLKSAESLTACEPADSTQAFSWRAAVTRTAPGNQADNDASRLSHPSRDRDRDIGSHPGRDRDIGSHPGRDRDIGSHPGRDRDIGSLGNHSLDAEPFGSMPRSQYYPPTFSVSESQTREPLLHWSQHGANPKPQYVVRRLRGPTGINHLAIEFSTFHMQAIPKLDSSGCVCVDFFPEASLEHNALLYNLMWGHGPASSTASGSTARSPYDTVAGNARTCSQFGTWDTSSLGNGNPPPAEPMEVLASMRIVPPLLAAAASGHYDFRSPAPLHVAQTLGLPVFSLSPYVALSFIPHFALYVYVHEG